MTVGGRRGMPYPCVVWAAWRTCSRRCGGGCAIAVGAGGYAAVDASRGVVRVVVIVHASMRLLRRLRRVGLRSCRLWVGVRRVRSR